MLLNALASLGHRGIKTIATFGRAGLMLFNAVVGKPEFRKHAPLLVRQLYNVGVLSMLIIIVSGIFIGMVLGFAGGADNLQCGDEPWHAGGAVAAARTGAGCRCIVVCRASRISVNSRNRFDARDGTAFQSGDDGGRSVAACDFATLLGGCDLTAAVDDNLRCRRDLGWFSGWC